MVPIPVPELDALHEALCETATSFNCREAEMIAGWYRRTRGGEAAAAELIEFHAKGDDEGDEHYLGEQAAD